jgi:3-oxoacyl-[acyl-carrier-protein] synthase III
MWAWADGGAAIVVGIASPRSPIALFLGAEMTSQSESNGHVLVPYGGTREPVAPPGVDPFARRVSNRDRREVKASYEQGYRFAHDALHRRLGIDAHRLVCNQITPPTVAMIAGALDVPMERVVITGHGTGHLGAADAVVGLQHLRDRGEIDTPIALGASTAYAFGVGLVVPPPSSPATDRA